MTFWLDRPVLLTGATGLVGSHLASALLARGASVVALVRDWRPDSLLVTSGDIDRVRVVRGDMRDRDLMEAILSRYEVDTLYHLAAQAVVSVGGVAPYQTFANNAMGAAAVLEAARNYGRLRSCVVASSDKAYGELSEQRAYVEDDPLNGGHPYDATKSVTDLWAQVYGNCYGLPVAVARCGNIYGAGDLNWNRLIPGTIRRLVRRQLPVIWGSGQERRDFIFIDDCVCAYLALAEHGARGAYNFSGGEAVSVKDCIDTICDLMGVQRNYTINNQLRGEIVYQELDITKARRDLGWLPRHSLADGLAEAVAWYVEYLR